MSPLERQSKKVAWLTERRRRYADVVDDYLAECQDEYDAKGLSARQRFSARRREFSGGMAHGHYLRTELHAAQVELRRLTVFSE